MAAISADDKKKLYVLGVVVGLALIVGGVQIIPGMLASKGEVPTATPTTEKTETDTGSPKPGGSAAGDAPGAESQAPDSGGAASSEVAGFSLLAAENARADPFVPYYEKIKPKAPPPKNQNIKRPPPLAIEIPLPMPGGDSFMNLPSMGSSSVSLPMARRRPGASSTLVSLPPINISQVSTHRLQPNLNRVLPPARSKSGAREVDPNTIRVSANKRLSGVIIGDGIYAILEISTGDAAGGRGAPGGGEGEGAPTTITRVVQPGDVVDGIKIVRIERTTEGGRTSTRMLIREDGQDRYVELKPLPQPAEGGAGGAPGGIRPRTGELPGFEHLIGSRPNAGGPRPRAGSGGAAHTNGWGPPSPP